MDAKDLLMPLHDDYKSEKDLKDIAVNIAPALNTILDEVEVQRYGFILFVVDLKEGMMQYISDTDPHQSLLAMEKWCARRKLDLENEERNNPDNSSR